MPKRIAILTMGLLAVFAGAAWAWHMGVNSHTAHPASVNEARRIVTTGAAGGGGVGGCITLVDSVAGGAQDTPFGNASVYRRASSWIPSSSHDLCKVVVVLRDQGAPIGNVYVRIYSDIPATGLPNAILRTSTTTLDFEDAVTGVTAAYTAKPFSISPSLAVAKGTRYWISIESDTLNDAANYGEVQYSSTGVNRIARFEAAWTLVDNSASIDYETYE